MITVHAPVHEGVGISCDEYSELPEVLTPLCENMQRLQDRFGESFISLDDLRSVFGSNIQPKTYDSLLKVSSNVLNALDETGASQFTHYVFPDPGLSARDMWILLSDRSANKKFLETAERFKNFDRCDAPVWRILPKNTFLNRDRSWSLRELFIGMHLHYLAVGYEIEGLFPILEHTDMHSYMAKYVDGRFYLITTERPSISRKH